MLQQLHAQSSKRRKVRSAKRDTDWPTVPSNATLFRSTQTENKQYDGSNYGYPNIHSINAVNIDVHSRS